MSPLKPTNSTPKDIKLCVVDVMRALRLILYWPQRLSNYAVKIHLENLTGSILHDALDDYSPGNENILKTKNCPESIKKRKVYDLYQQLPKGDEW